MQMAKFWAAKVALMAKDLKTVRITGRNAGSLLAFETGIHFELFFGRRPKIIHLES